MSYHKCSLQIEQQQLQQQIAQQIQEDQIMNNKKQQQQDQYYQTQTPSVEFQLNIQSENYQNIFNQQKINSFQNDKVLNQDNLNNKQKYSKTQDRNLIKGKILLEGNQRNSIQVQSFSIQNYINNQNINTFLAEKLLYQQYQHQDSDQFSSQSQQQHSTSQISGTSFARSSKSSVRRTFLLNDDFYGSNRYSSLRQSMSKQQTVHIQKISRKISQLQSIIKRQHLLFEYQEKMKNQRIKQIQYSYVNSFTNYLVLRGIKDKYMGKGKDVILLNNKDITQIDQGLLQDLMRFKKVMIDKVIGKKDNVNDKKISKSFKQKYKDQTKNQQELIPISNIISQTQKPPLSFLIDFHNFFPNWQQNIHSIMKSEFQSCNQIEQTFQSQYRFSSAVLSSLKYRDNIYRFCQVIFQKLLVQLNNTKQQLIIDFGIVYQKWQQKIYNMSNTNYLKLFIQGQFQSNQFQDQKKNQKSQKNTKKSIISQLTKFFNQKMPQQQYQKLLIQLNHFAKNRNAINFLIEQIGPDDIQVKINLRLALLVYKKIQINRRKLEKLSLMFINEILNRKGEIPIEIKFIVNQFKILAKEKMKRKHNQEMMKRKENQESNEQNNMINYQMKQGKFQLKYQDLKSFFNKIIFSQIFFSTFMSLYEEQHFQISPLSNFQIKIPPNNTPTKINNNPNIKVLNSNSNYNLTMMALIGQKIIFGQQFLQKFKYGYFNNIIKEYQPKIKKFILSFTQNQTIKFTLRKQVQTVLISVESIKYWYQVLRKKELIRELESFEQTLIPASKNQTMFELGSTKYEQQNMYLMLVINSQNNYLSVFRPKNKLRRTFIEFLMMIQTINDGITYNEVLQQYKILQQNQQNSRPSIQIYANYLYLFADAIERENIIQQIEQSIYQMKKEIQQTKIRLQKQYNIGRNIQNLYLKLLNQKRAILSKKTITNYINFLIMLPMQFDYIIHEGKICQAQINNKNYKKKQRIYKQVLEDIVKYFKFKYQGLDVLYGILIDQIIKEIQKQGVNDEDMKQSVREIIGQKLFIMIKLNDKSIQMEKDRKIYNQMKRHSFIRLKHLGMQQYQQEQQILLQLSLPIISRLSQPSSPQKIIKIFQQTTMIIQNIITCVGKASDMNSDVQIPITQFILIKSGIKNLNSILQFVKFFGNNNNGSNKQALLITLLESICYLLETISVEHLNISKEQYMKEIQKDYLIIE